MEFMPNLGRFYLLCKELGETHRLNTSFLDKLIGPEWDRTNFRDGEMNVEIIETPNGLFLDMFPNTIRIFFRGREVYHANINKYSADYHQVVVRSQNPDWENAAVKVKYSGA